MPKGNSGTEDRAKVKLRVIEFELEGSNASVENSIRQLTNALTTRAVVVKPLGTKPVKELAGATSEGGTDDLEEEGEVLEADAIETNGNGVPVKKAPRVKPKPKAPTYLHEMNTTGNGTSFKDFAKEKGPTTRSKQYLVAAYWLKEHGDSATVNADKMYTCFKTATWPVGFNNWRSTFDNLVHSEHMRKVDVGEFAINPLGEEVVTKGTEV
jgi:hypothetical protein